MIPDAENRADKEPWSQGGLLAYATYGYVVRPIYVLRVEAGYVTRVHVRGVRRESSFLIWLSSDWGTDAGGGSYVLPSGR